MITSHTEGTTTTIQLVQGETVRAVVQLDENATYPLTAQIAGPDGTTRFGIRLGIGDASVAELWSVDGKALLVGAEPTTGRPCVTVL